eukprot:m.39566 g.39566  ORF g.39566 m.39566 type:complete len:157 (-) comp16640_c0_seq1:95-565(-)
MLSAMPLVFTNLHARPPWTIIGAAAVTDFILSGLWYGGPPGQYWLKGMRKLKQKPNWPMDDPCMDNAARNLAVGAVLATMKAYVVTTICVVTGGVVADWRHGFEVGSFFAIGLLLPNCLQGALWEDIEKEVVLIDTLGDMLRMIIMGTLVGFMLSP